VDGLSVAWEEEGGGVECGQLQHCSLLAAAGGFESQSALTI
jgi:hypothetical protein